MQHIVKNSGHGSLIGGASILKTGHDSIKEIAHKSPKSSLYSIERIHIDLIVATETVHKGKIRVSSNGVD